MTSGWRSGYDTVSMHRHMQGASLYIPERFGADRTLYGEVMVKVGMNLSNLLPRINMADFLLA